MRKLIFLLLLLLIATPVFAQQQEARMSLGVVGGSVPVGGCGDANCPSGTYMFRWDGDYLGDTDKACKANCASALDGTASGATIGTDYGESGNGVLIDAANEQIYYTITAGDIFDSSATSVGTVCLDVYVDIEGAVGANQNTVFEVNTDATASNGLYVVTYTSGAVRGYYTGNGDTDSVSSGASQMVGRTWTTIKYTWDQPNSKHKIKVGANAAVEDTADGLQGFAVTPDKLRIGELKASVDGTPDPTWIDKVRVYSTYDATCGD